ncbi:MAG: hypothetical protein ACP5OF_01545 [bacterium]
MKRILLIILILGLITVSKAFAFEQRIPFAVTQTTFTGTTFSGTVTSTTVTYQVTIYTSQIANSSICPTTIGGAMILGASCLYCNNATACIVNQAGDWLAIISSGQPFTAYTTVEGQ